MKNIYTFLLSALLLSSCANTKYMNIDIYEPAVVTLDSTIVNVLVVNNIPNSYQLSKKYKDKSEKELAVINDSTKWNFVKLLSKYMDEENYFGSVINYDYLIRRDTIFGIDLPLTKRQVVELCESTESDAIISLDKMTLSLSLDKILNVDDYDKDIVELDLTALIRTYTANGQMLKPQIIVADSLFWEGSSLGYRVIEPLPDLTNMTKEINTHFADKLVNYFIPHWKTTTRFYYLNGKSEMKKADQAMQNTNWTEAEEYWTKLFEKETNSVNKIKLAYNLALVNECQNKIENAKKWIEISYDLINETNNKTVINNTVAYNIELDRRINNQQKLEEQLGN